MSEVRRWEPRNTVVGYDMQPLPDGSFVLFEDFDRVTAERDAALGREAALREELSLIIKSFDELAECVGFSEARLDQTGDSPIDCAKQLQQRLTAADERADHNARVSAIAVEDVLLMQKRADVLEAENRRLREDDLFYDAACEAMEGHQKERAKLGKEIGCQGSLIDGIAWIYQRLSELEKSPSGYTKQHHPVEFGPSDSRRFGCSCGHPDPNHEAAKP